MTSTFATVSDFTEKVGIPLTVALIGLAGAVIVAAVSFALGRLSEAATRRREGYAAATRELVAWAEYPYRIRRRTSDDPAVLTSLTERGHAIQESLRFRETWIGSENQWVANVFRETRADLGKIIGPSCNDAWTSPPIGRAADMPLGSWGPAGVDALIARFEKATEFRFGWRRVLAAVGYRPKSIGRPPLPALPPA